MTTAYIYNKNQKVVKSVKQRQLDWLKANPWPVHMFRSSNVIGEAIVKVHLDSRNEALAEPRNDERFHNIGTMHPKNSGRFTGKTARR
jgi:hypothetical protein